MIFVTVGTQLPFDRLITAVDAWAGASPGRAVFAQIGPSGSRPRHLEYAHFISPDECDERMRSARAVVAHAGMGTILTALQLGTRLLVMPRRADLGEHRNDHQLATAQRLSQVAGLRVAFDEAELTRALDALDSIALQPPISDYAPEDFLACLRACIAGQARSPAALELPNLA